MARALGLAAGALGLLLVCCDVAAVAVPGHPLGAAVRQGLASSCHQSPRRSFSHDGRPLPACARCTGLHLSALAGGVLLLGLRERHLRRLSPAPVAAAALVPIGADVLLGLAAGGAWDHAVLRASTGVVAGSGLLLACGALLQRERGAATVEVTDGDRAAPTRGTRAGGGAVT